MIIGGNTQQLNILQNRFTKEQLEQKKIDILKENETLQTEYNRLVQGRGLGKLIGSVAGGIPALERKITSNNQTIKQINRILAQDSDIFPVKDFSQEITNLQPSIPASGEEQVDQESQIQADEEVTPKPEPQPQPKPDPTPKPVPEPKPEADINPLFDNPNFSILIRNIGKSLAETGQVGSGLTLGAAAAAEEVAVREAQKEAAQQELLKEAIKAGAKKALDPKFKAEVDQKYIDNTQRIEENKGSLDFLNQIENILLTENPTGIPGLARQIGYNFRALLDPNAELDPKTRVENLLREIAVGDAETVLGQSSGRLSDKDIQLARQLVSEIEGISGAFTSESAITSVLARRRADIERDQATAASELMQSNILYNEYGLKPPPTAIFDYLSTSPSALNTNIAGEANLGD